MENILNIRDVHKSFLGKRALNGVDLSIDSGSMVGLLGPNGSGKTTLIKIIAGLIKQNSGEVQICGKRPGTETKAFVSYLSDTQHLYSWMRVEDAIGFYDDLFTDFNREKCESLLTRMDIDRGDKVKSLSRGMFEKTSLALTLARDARLYLLDEPLGGIDPVARDTIIDTILANYSPESSFIISTHLVSDIERLFDTVAFINEGKIILSGDAEELRTERSMSIENIYKEVFRNAYTA